MRACTANQLITFNDVHLQHWERHLANVFSTARLTSRKNSLLLASCTTAAVRPAALLPLPLVYTQMGATCSSQQQQQQWKHSNTPSA
jgi:hypothetical protein